MCFCCFIVCCWNSNQWNFIFYVFVFIAKVFNLSYFTGKLSAFSGERLDFDSERAQEELNEWYLETKEDVSDVNSLNELYEDLLDAIRNWSLKSHFEQAVFSIYEHTSVDWFESEEATMVSDFGSRLPYRLIAYWLGFQMVIEQIGEGVE